MSAVSYAVTFQCGFPGCQSVGEAPARDQPPTGWLTAGLRGPEVRDAFGSSLRDFCTLHVDTPLSKLFRVLTERAGTS